MKKLTILLSSVAMAGAFLFATVDKKEQPNQQAVAKEAIQLRAVTDPGGGMG